MTDKLRHHHGSDTKDTGIAESILMILVGFVILPVIAPMSWFEIRGSASGSRLALWFAGWFVFALISLFFARGSYVKSSVQTGKNEIKAWMIILCVWMSFLLIQLIVWVWNLDEWLKPSWLQWS